MMRFFVILVSLVFLGCQDVTRPQKPEDLIPMDKMVDVLVEAYLANAAQSVRNKTIVHQGIKMDSLIYTKYGIDSLQFVKSNEYYAADANVYLDIFKKVEEKLEGYEQELDSLLNKDRFNSQNEEIRRNRNEAGED